MANERFDPKTMSVRDLKNAPIEVIKTEISGLAQALGVRPADLLRSLGGLETGAPSGLGLEARTMDADAGNTCCNSDSW